MSFETLLVERDGAVVVVTINRPKVLNALNRQTISDLQRALVDFEQDTAVRAIVITGAGEKAFVAGADINELAVLSPAEGQLHARRGQAVFNKIEQLGKPVIAAINGFALGGGCELAMACTLRVASDTAKLGQPEVNLGLIPGYAGSQRLPRLVGKGLAFEILLSGEMVSAARAYEIGLVNRVVPAAELLPQARELAGMLAAKAPLAVRLILQAVNHGGEMPQDDAQFLEASLFGLVASSEDMKEGTRAFLEKRPASWQGR
jgi:enoyl-CoA hydratase